jgi:hypothetical protein
MSRSLFLLLVCDLLVGVSLAFPSGAPISACITMLPDHFVPPQTIPNPYKLLVVNLGNGTYTGSLEKIDASVPDFKGFLIQARAENSTVPVGFFDQFADGSKALSCTDTADSITHDSNIFKQSMTFSWIAPEDDVDGIRYVATVCQEQIVFWTGLESLDLGTILP